MTSSVSDGSQLAVITTEHTLDTITTAGSYVLSVDTSAMQLADKLTLRIYTKVRSVGVTRLAYLANYSQAQTLPVKVSVPVGSAHEIQFTLEQTAGTGRDYPWEVTQLDA